MWKNWENDESSVFCSLENDSGRSNTTELFNNSKQLFHFGFERRFVLPTNSSCVCFTSPQKNGICNEIEWCFFLRWPFDWKNPLGYLFFLIAESITCWCINLYGLIGLCFLIGSTWMLMSFTKDITNELAHLNANETGTSTHRQTNVKVRFNAIIKSYSDAKQFS